MADRVRNEIHNFILEMETLKSRGFFEEREVRRFVQEKTDLYYLLIKRQVAPLDFIINIEFEMNLENQRI